jgi:hypothetical protein
MARVHNIEKYIIEHLFQGAFLMALNIIILKEICRKITNKSDKKNQEVPG